MIFIIACTSQRVEVSLDLGWRTAPSDSPPCSFPLVSRGFRYSGGDHNNAWEVSDAHDVPSCAAAACAAGVAAFGLNSSQNCFIGDQSKWDSTPSHPEFGTVYLRNVSGWPPPQFRQAALSLDDSQWEVVDLPHDASAKIPRTPNSGAGEGFLPPVASVYRKHFTLPAMFNSSVVTLVIEGAVTSSSWWLNGAQLVPLQVGGYLPMVLRLDGSGAPLFFGTQENVLAVWTDTTMRTGWWGEGAGLLRGRSRLLITPATARIEVHGTACPSFVNGTIQSQGAPSTGLYADSVLFPSANVTVDASVKGHLNVTLSWSLSPLGNASHVVASVSASASLPGGAATRVSSAFILPNASLWSVARPALYTLTTELRSSDGSLLDSVDDVIGVRDLSWSGDAGLRVNDAITKLRGWCDHETWGGLGAALPERVGLLRLQQLRGVGGNAYRSSHNPPAPSLLDIADRLGVIVLDENRVLATSENVPFRNDTWGWRDLPISYSGMGGDVARDAALLAARDHNHASVAFYSICNELGCGAGDLLDNDLVLAVKSSLDAFDGSRAMTGNMGWQSPQAVEAGTPISDVFDVMGMSHQSLHTLEAYHAAAPFKAVVMSECCSCETQRGEDADLLLSRNVSTVYFSSDDNGCFERETQWSNTPYAVGTFIWTLSDYNGESGSFPHVSSSFGVIDYAGFPKPSSYWFRSWWLANISANDASRPPLPVAATSVYCKLVESWQPSANNSRVIHVHTNAPSVQLSINGVPFASAPVELFGTALFPAVSYVPNSTLEVLCSLPDGGPSATDSSTLATGAMSIILSLDAPSPTTGTGFGKVFSDGLDVALIRAMIVDVFGRVCVNCSHNITFSITGLGGILVGAHNGDPAFPGVAGVVTVPAYHGLARAIARSTVDASGTAEERALRAAVNVDAGKGPSSSSVWQDGAPPPPAFFTVSAEASGVAGSSIIVELSTAEADTVLEAARNSVQLADFS